MATKKSVVPAVTAPAVDVNALMVMVQQLQQQVAAQAVQPAKAAKAAKEEKPKAGFDAKKLAAELTGKPGVIEEKTQKGRRKLTAFCADGSIVSVIL